MLSTMGRCDQSGKGMNHISGTSMEMVNNSATVRTKTMEEALIKPTRRQRTSEPRGFTGQSPETYSSTGGSKE